MLDSGIEAYFYTTNYSIQLVAILLYSANLFLGLGLYYFINSPIFRSSGSSSITDCTKPRHHSISEDGYCSCSCVLMESVLPCLTAVHSIDQSKPCFVFSLSKRVVGELVIAQYVYRTENLQNIRDCK